mmetsp:Transcript_39272/g.100659  ORF Transcript_39272/g.100659 Transcript_39272/m.100659 type:complete len:88 (+) Transcript_39272:898-1161(+)
MSQKLLQRKCVICLSDARIEILEVWRCFLLCPFLSPLLSTWHRRSIACYLLPALSSLLSFITQNFLPMLKWPKKVYGLVMLFFVCLP